MDTEERKEDLEIEKKEELETEKRVDPEVGPEIQEQTGPVPPAIPEEAKIESEWADKLGMDYDPERYSEDSEEPEPEEMNGGERPSQVPPIYVMPASQPLQPSGQTPEPMPPTYMVWAILSTICCCLPAGIVAIVFSTQVSSKYYARDYEGARKASRTAEIWIIASIVAGIVVNAVYTPISMLMQLMSM